MVLGKVSIKIEDGLHLVGGQLCTIEIQALEELQRWNEQRRFHRRQIVSLQVQHPQLTYIFSDCSEQWCCLMSGNGATLQTNPAHIWYFLVQDFGIYSRQVNWAPRFEHSWRNLPEHQRWRWTHHHEYHSVIWSAPLLVGKCGLILKPEFSIGFS